MDEMDIIISNYRYFVDIMNSNERVRNVVKKLRTTQVEPQAPNMLIVYYSDEGMCFFNVDKVENKIRYVTFISTGA
jgi:hypothetical protein